jgi:integrase
MGHWEAQVRDYLALRSRLGYTLRTTGDELVLFAQHLENIGHRGPLTADIAIRWAKLATNAKPEYWAWRLGAVRLFVKHLTATDPRHEVPAADALGRGYTRRNPHIYSDEEIAALLDATRMIRPTNALPPHTFRAFFGLLATTGMRCGEALALQRGHVDLVSGRLEAPPLSWTPQQARYCARSEPWESGREGRSQLSSRPTRFGCAKRAGNRSAGWPRASI